MGVAGREDDREHLEDRAFGASSHIPAPLVV